tara:strand:- start:951 stop:1514 length:564 start_codon:yes stop_codon:yes gene_type:complete
MANLVTSVEIAGAEGFPSYLSPTQLEGLLSNTPGSNGHCPEDLSFIVLTQDPGYDGSPLVGSLLAEEKEVEGFAFDYYDGVSVHPDHSDNGVVKGLLDTARIVGGDKPSLLRTSDPELDEVYGTMSDVSIKVGDFYIHGFGFFDKYGLPLFDGAEGKFDLAVKYVADLPQTLVEEPQTPTKAPELPQ